MANVLLESGSIVLMESTGNVLLETGITPPTSTAITGAVQIHHILADRVYPTVLHQHKVVPGGLWASDPKDGFIRDKD